MKVPQNKYSAQLTMLFRIVLYYFTVVKQSTYLT